MIVSKKKKKQKMSASYNSVRAFGGILLHRVSNGVSFRTPRIGLRGLHSSSAISSSSFQWDSITQTKFSCEKVRPIWTFSPLCMGRRSEKIADRKGKQMAKKMKLCTKIGKEVVSALKKGGPNPVINLTLAAVLEKAKQLDIPKEILDRNIKRASEKNQEAYIEKVYEVYGFAGVSMVVECLTDKITRSVADVRNVLRECGGKMADSGSVTFKFRRARVVNVKASEVDKDTLLSVALECGAEDIIEPSEYEDDTDDEDQSECYYKIVTSTENYSEVLSKLREQGIKYEPDNGSELLPMNPIEVDDEARELNRELMDRLLELDDVDAVYSDQK